jgi:ABC-type maltose transport system permease subunit
MDLSNPWTLLSGLILGGIGMVLFMYGKKQTDLRCIAAGAVLCIVPYVIGSMLVLWLVSAAILGGLIAWVKFA